MAGTQRVKEETIETARLLGHQMAPFTVHGDKEITHCRNALCKGTIIVQGSDAEGYSLSHICPFLEHRGQNGEP